MSELTTPIVNPERCSGSYDLHCHLLERPNAD